MFSVHSVTGQTFRGTLEQFLAISGLHGARHSRVDRAWQALVGRSYGQAPVLDGSYRLVGQVSVEDLLTVINVDQGRVRDVLPQAVADLMLSPVVSADPVADIRRVARVLLDQRLGGMPVVSDRGELVGIITRSDILRALVNDPPLSLWA